MTQCQQRSNDDDYKVHRFECSICLCSFTKNKRAPISIHCGHSFCAICLPQMFKAGEIPCPICRQITRVANPKELKKNVFLVEAIEDELELSESDEKESAKKEAPKKRRKKMMTFELGESSQRLETTINQVAAQQQIEGIIDNIAAAHGSGSFNDQLGVDDLSRRSVIQQQLMLILHAYGCNQRGRDCRVSHCETMKRVLTHALSCTASRGQCAESHCASSKQIIMHYKSCKSDECPVCKPVNQVINYNQQLASPHSSTTYQPKNVTYQHNDYSPRVNSLFSHTAPPMPMNSNRMRIPHAKFLNPPPVACQIRAFQNQSQCQSQNEPMFKQWINPGIPEPEAPSIAKQWHSTITKDLRQHLISKLVKAIFPSADASSIGYQRFRDLIQYAKKIEKENFEQANDKEMYYHMLAEKMYRVQKQLEEKKKCRMLQMNAGGLFA